MTCTGFSHATRHFDCADSVSLLNTAILIFVPSLLLFTVAPPWGYCLFVMSLISRPHAQLPQPVNFGSKLSKDAQNLMRTGNDSTIHDHNSFRQIIAGKGMSIPPMARKYREMRTSSPKRIFIVDFESVWHSEKGLPLCSIEVTVLNENGEIVISSIINDEGVTNAGLRMDSGTGIHQRKQLSRYMKNSRATRDAPFHGMLEQSIPRYRKRSSIHCVRQAWILTAFELNTRQCCLITDA